MCPLHVPGLANTNVYNVALENGATVWDTLAVSNLSSIAAASNWGVSVDGATDGTTTAAGNLSAVAPSKVALPCYLPGSPVADYLGGDQAHMMMAWGNAQDIIGAGMWHARLAGILCVLWPCCCKATSVLCALKLQPACCVPLLHLPA